MSMATLGRAILIEAQALLNNPKLKKKDIIEWNTGELNEIPGETTIQLPELQINVAVLNKHDLRPKAAASSPSLAGGE